MHNWAAGGGNGDALQAERKKQADRLWAGTQACLRKIRLAWHELGVGSGTAQSLSFILSSLVSLGAEARGGEGRWRVD